MLDLVEFSLRLVRALVEIGLRLGRTAALIVGRSMRGLCRARSTWTAVIVGASAGVMVRTYARLKGCVPVGCVGVRVTRCVSPLMRSSEALPTTILTRRRSRIFAGILLWVVAAGALLADAPGKTLTEHRCRLHAPRLPAALAYCSELVVPENRAAPNNASLTLYVARVPALTAAPQPDPLVLIAGGPGQSAVDLYLQTRRAFEPVRRERDILLLDQRGTGRSADGFRCDLTESAALETAMLEELRAATTACVQRLERDPRFFTTEHAVEDLDALRAAMGLGQWNIYGISYGTRVAQRYASRFPDRVRTLVLDGVVPAALVLGPSIAADAQEALEGIFRRCAEDAKCAARYPELAERFAGLRVRLESGPVAIDVPNPKTGKIETRLFSDTDFAGVVRLMSYTSATASLLPLAIDEAYEGRYTMLAAQVDLLSADLAAAMNMPMHHSVVCTEDAPYYSGEVRSEAKDAYLGRSIVDALTVICSEWPTAPPPAGLKEPLEFDRPVLLFSGELDPVTPPHYAAETMAAGLRQAVHIIAPGQGHGIAAIGCAPRLIATFIESASTASVSGRCLAAEPPAPFFLSRAGPAP